MADAAALGLSEDRVTWSDLRRYRGSRARSARILAWILLVVAGGAIAWLWFENHKSWHVIEISPRIDGNTPARTKTVAAEAKAARGTSLCSVFEEWQSSGKFGGILRRGAALSARCGQRALKKPGALKKRG
ncbi:MAG: hypothetical protein HYW49_02100 [Deltaproteobacteria bacterium]|nr:hypothetical protein [Deltaproteobacteria bacterium]